MIMNWRIETHDSLPSTQDVLKRPEYSNAAEGTVIQTRIQTAGRGRRGRVWVGDQAGNLYLSFLLRPNLKPQQFGQIGLVAGIALAQAIRPLLKNPADLVLKWPNDILLAGKKCAGILVETDATNNVIVGVGVNVKTAPLEHTARLNDFCVAPVHEDDLRDRILYIFSDLYKRWLENEWGVLHGEWLANALPAGTPMTVKHGGQIRTGWFETIDDGGNLILRTENGTREIIMCGEVFL